MIDHDSVRARIDEFDRRNGADAIFVDGYWLYSNGASRDDEPLGVLEEPPRDELERLRRSIFYFNTCLDRAKDDFIRYRQELLERAKASGYIPDDYKKKLENLRKSVHANKMVLDDLLEEYNEHPRIKKKREEAEADKLRKELAAQEIASIEI